MIRKKTQENEMNFLLDERSSADSEDTSESLSSISVSIDDIESVSRMSLPISKRIINSDKVLSDKWVVWMNSSDDGKEFCDNFEQIFEFDTMNKFHNEWSELILKSKRLQKDAKIYVFRQGVMVKKKKKRFCFLFFLFLL